MSHKHLLLTMILAPFLFFGLFPIYSAADATQELNHGKYVDIRGAFAVMVSDNWKDGHAGYIYQLISIEPGHKVYRLRFSKQPVGIKAGSIIEVKGILLGDQIVVDNRGIQS